MSERTSFYRKVAYGVAIAVLLFPLALLSSPATVSDKGGKLAQLRTDLHLSQADLGKVDPASETMKLATLGLRGVAVNLLWEKANYYKKVEDWTNLTATLEQLAKLQPNFVTFWKFQAWNLTYNVSVEFDDYRDRYYYVRRGIQFLEEGEKYNVDNPHLLWDLGWFIGQKIGRADEHVQYRKLFKKDDDFHPPDRSPDQRDNWLVGKEYYLKAIDAVDNKGRSLDRKTPRIFYSSPAMSQMDYADAIEEEGYFDKARRAWIKASEEWDKFGNLVLEHSTGVKMRLGYQPRLEQEVAALKAKLEAMEPDARQQIVEEKKAALKPNEREILATPEEKLTSQQRDVLYQLSGKIEVTNRDIAERIGQKQPEQAKEALQLANDLDRKEKELQYTINYKGDSNYDYWETRAKLEQTPDALAAREAMFQAHQAFRQADLMKAKQLYQEGFAKWRLVFDAFPKALNSDFSTGDDLIDFIKQYRDVLDQLDETIGDDFPLWDAVEQFDREQVFKEELAAHKDRTGTAKPKSGTSPDGTPGSTSGEKKAAPPSADAKQPSAGARPAGSAAKP
jgi:hypothetical protein